MFWDSGSGDGNTWRNSEPSTPHLFPLFPYFSKGSQDNANACQVCAHVDEFSLVVCMPELRSARSYIHTHNKAE